jgi:hypothetical protein
MQIILLKCRKLNSLTILSLRADLKKHTLHILLRLTLDTAVSHNDMVIASLEATIDYLLSSIPHEEFGKVVRHLFSSC